MDQRRAKGNACRLANKRHKCRKHTMFIWYLALCVCACVCIFVCISFHRKLKRSYKLSKNQR